MTPAENKRPYGLIILALISAAIAVRAPGLYHDFWMDEIWSLTLVAPLTAPSQIFTHIHFDLNHWLHSLILFAIGDHPYWPVYRMPAFGAACASLLVVAFWPGMRSQRERLLALVVFGASFVLIVYSTEARGYAWLILFSLLCYRCLLVCGGATRPAVVFLFWACAILGFLSQVTFVFVYAALGLWSLAVFYAASKRLGRTLCDMILFFMVPGVFFCWLYVVDIRHVQHGGAGAGTLLGTWIQFSGWILGTPAEGWLGGVTFALLIILVAFTSYRMARTGDLAWVLYAGLITVPVLVAIMTSRAGFSYWKPRHFIGVAPFFLFLLARGISALWGRGRAGSWLAGAALAVFLIGNAVRTATFITRGRGHYLDAMRHIAERTPGGVIEIGSDHDFRNSMVISFYARYLPDHEVRYVTRDRWVGAGPDWFLVHAQETGFKPQATLSNPDSGRRYNLDAAFAYSGISGWNWYVYRNGADEGEALSPEGP